MNLDTYRGVFGTLFWIFIVLLVAGLVLVGVATPTDHLDRGMALIGGMIGASGLVGAGMCVMALASLDCPGRR